MNDDLSNQLERQAYDLAFALVHGLSMAEFIALLRIAAVCVQNDNRMEIPHNQQPIDAVIHLVHKGLVGRKRGVLYLTAAGCMACRVPVLPVPDCSAREMEPLEQLFRL